MLKELTIIDNEECISESYEMMNIYHFLYSIILYIILIIISLIMIYFSPNPTLEKEYIIDINNKTKEIRFLLELKQLIFLHGKIQLTISTISNFSKSFVAFIYGFINLKKNNRIIQEIQLDNEIFKITNLKETEIFFISKFNGDSILADFELILKDGLIKNLLIKWKFENLTFFFFSLLIKLFLLIILIFLLFNYNKSFKKISKNLFPTFLQSFLKRMIFLLILFQIPLKELLIFKYFNKFKLILEIFNLISIYFKLFLLIISIYNLLFKFSESESLIHEYIFINFLIFIIYIILNFLFNEKIFFLNDNFIIIFLFLLNFYILSFPFKLNNNSLEFKSIFSHIIIILISTISIIFEIFFKNFNNSKESLLNNIILTFSICYLYLLHWPREILFNDQPYYSQKNESSSSSSSIKDNLKERKKII